MRSLFQDLRYSIPPAHRSCPASRSPRCFPSPWASAPPLPSSASSTRFLMDPYPYAAPDRMVHMRTATRDGDLSGFGLTGTASGSSFASHQSSKTPSWKTTGT